MGLIFVLPLSSYCFNLIGCCNVLVVLFLNFQVGSSALIKIRLLSTPVGEAYHERPMSVCRRRFWSRGFVLSQSRELQKATGVSHLRQALCFLIASVSGKKAKMPFFKSASSLRSDSSDLDMDGLGNFLGREGEYCRGDACSGGGRAGILQPWIEFAHLFPLCHLMERFFFFLSLEWGNGKDSFLAHYSNLLLPKFRTLKKLC